MSSLIIGPSTLTSPLSNWSAAGRLVGAVVQRARLASADRDRMYELMERYFDGTERSRFEEDLVEKELVLILREVNSGEIQGFSTLARMELAVDSRDIVAFFSGDTIIAKEFWGESILSRLWCQTVFPEAERIVADRPSAQVFWFLICSGYKTYRFLPIFFREFYPCPDHDTPADLKRVLDTLGEMKFGNQYDSKSGIVRFTHAAPLRDGVADITERRMNDPIVNFFQGRNTCHARGDELACITRISRSNLTRAGERMLSARLASR